MHYSRVRKEDEATFTTGTKTLLPGIVPHRDRISEIVVSEIDTSICCYEYRDLYDQVLLCRRAANFLATVLGW